jgi:polygalacturonase
MRILFPLRGHAARKRPFLNHILWTAACTAAPMLAWNSARANPTLPTIGPVVYNVTLANGGVAGASVDGGLTATGDGATDNTNVLQSFLFAASSTQTVVGGQTVDGATVEIPASAAPYITNSLFIPSNVNVQIDSGATVQNMNSSNPLLASFDNQSNVEISGGGILNDNATTTSEADMIELFNVNDVLVNGVTIENASHEHLVTEGTNNVTINSISIHDSITQANTDGIDYSGTNYLIENSTISDGDDDIVAKPDEVPCANISIMNDTILAGHGISIGGETEAGLNNLTVNNVTINGTSFGIRLKAGRGSGGLVTNLTFNDITMIDMNTPIEIDSWYNSTSGSDNYPPQAATNATMAAVNSTTPFWSNITFSNIVVQSTTQKSQIYGLPEAPVQNVQFINDNLGNDNLQVNFAGFNGTYDPTLVPGEEVLIDNTTINRNLMTSQSQLSNGSFFIQSPNGLYEADVAIEVPEPSCGFLLAGGLMLGLRRRGRGQSCR